MSENPKSTSEAAEALDPDGGASATADAVGGAADGERKTQAVPRGAMLAVQLALPIVLCGAAIGVHWALNVPDVIKESPGDQGSKKGAKKKKKKKKKPRKKRTRAPRSAAALDRAWKRWSSRDFDDEPVSVDWAHRHQSLVRKAFLAARTSAFEGAPEQAVVTLESADCHTVRCRLLMGSPFPHQNDAIADALSRLQTGSKPLWRDYEAFRVPTPEGFETGKPHDYVQVTVAFVTDDVKPGSMAVAEPEADSGDIVAVPAAPKPESPSED